MIRAYVKRFTRLNLATRYAFLATWRLLVSFRDILRRKSTSGERPWHQEEIQRYAEMTFSNYKLWGGVNRFYGRVAEVGPGNVSATAELLLADGCSQVDQIDRFDYIFNGAHPAIHRYQEPAESFFSKHRDYDFILSCAVMEHLYDPMSALRAMASALKPNGVMIHAVDCRDHNQFSDTFHDLSFLRFSALLYWPLTLASGLNRNHLSSYTGMLSSLGLSFQILVTALSGCPGDIVPARELSAIDRGLLERSRQNVASIRRKLAAPFRDLPEEDLMISGFVLVARR